MNLLEVENLSVRYGSFQALSGVSFSVPEGSWLMIVGPNGAGKSTIINALSRGVGYSGSIFLNGREIRSIRPDAAAREVGVLRQTHSVGLGFTVEEVVRLGRYAYGRRSPFSSPNEKDAEIVENALITTGLAELRDHSVLTLSGGELQRTFLAQVLAQDPKLVLLDEPVNHLDLLYQKQVMALMSGWMRKKGRAVVSVIHDLSLAKAYGTDALLMNGGKVAAWGKKETVLTEDNLNGAYGMDVFEWNRGLFAQWTN